MVDVQGFSMIAKTMQTVYSTYSLHINQKIKIESTSWLSWRLKFFEKCRNLTLIFQFYEGGESEIVADD